VAHYTGCSCLLFAIMATADRCLELFTVVKSKYNLPFELKQEQLNILNLLLDGKNVLDRNYSFV